MCAISNSSENQISTLKLLLPVCFSVSGINAAKEGRSAVPFDVRYNDVTMDLLSDLGFSNALFQTLNLECGSGALSAPVCSTFIFMPLGPLKVSSSSTRSGNLQTFGLKVYVQIHTSGDP